MLMRQVLEEIKHGRISEDDINLMLKTAMRHGVMFPTTILSHHYDQAIRGYTERIEETCKGFAQVRITKVNYFPPTVAREGNIQVSIEVDWKRASDVQTASSVYTKQYVSFQEFEFDVPSLGQRIMRDGISKIHMMVRRVLEGRGSGDEVLPIVHDNRVRHAQAYLDYLAKAIEAFPVCRSDSIEQLIADHMTDDKDPWVGRPGSVGQPSEDIWG